MTKRRSHPLVAWLCLIWFGLTNTVFAGGMMLCNDGHGGSRIEWGGCEQNADGECLVSCARESEDEPDAPHPCQDTPIPGQEQITKAPPRSASDTVIPVPVLVAVIVLWADAPVATQVAWATSEPERPPDVLRHIRTVVLLV